MSIKEQLLALVRAFNKLVTTPTDNTAALVSAQADAKAAIDALAAYKAADPPEPTVVAEVTPELLGPPVVAQTPPGNTGA